MRTQSNRSTQYPLFVVQEQKEVVKAEGCGDREIYVNGEEQLDAVEFQRREELLNNDEEILDDDGEVIENFDPYDWRRIEISDEWVISDTAGVFFTEVACDLHIAQNNYHYSKPRSYVTSAWRNYELQQMMQMLLKLTGEEIPSHYK